MFNLAVQRHYTFKVTNKETNLYLKIFARYTSKTTPVDFGFICYLAMMSLFSR